MHRSLAWRRLDPPGFELAFAELSGDRLRARGTVLVAGPLAYRMAYEVETAAGFATSRFEAEVRGLGWSRWVDLERHPDGWSCKRAASGEVDLPAPGGDVVPLEEAVDVDLAASPLFNTLPVLRLGLVDAADGSPRSLVAAFVSVPDLAVGPLWQSYEPLGTRRVRYVSVDSGFTAGLELDEDGFVVAYPGLAARVDSTE